jgi:hypothetical protein
MEALAKNRSVIQIVGIFVLVMLAYNLFFKPDAPAEKSPSVSPATLGADIVKMSTELSKATLGQELFSNPGYLYLIDFSSALPKDSVGRLNPFDSIGR